MQILRQKGVVILYMFMYMVRCQQQSNRQSDQVEGQENIILAHEKQGQVDKKESVGRRGGQHIIP